MMIDVVDKAYQLLRDIANHGSSPQKIVQRCRIILTSHKRKHSALVAEELSVHDSTVRKWTTRWEDFLPIFLMRWGNPNFKPKDAILTLLSDAKRSGAPPTYTPEQVTEIVVLSCRNPMDLGRPITHWTLPELADEVVKQGIAERISETTIRRFLKSACHSTPQDPLLAEPQN